MAEKYFEATGEIAFRLWMFAKGVEVLQSVPNAEKAQNLKGKMEAFLEVVAEKGTEENLKDLKFLISKL